MPQISSPPASSSLDFQRFLEQSYDPVMITDREGRIVYVNRAFEQRTGYGRREVLGRTPRLLKSGWHDPSFYRQLWQSILSGEVFHGVFVNRKRDGESYHAEQVITPIRDGKGAITHFLSVWRDVTARQRVEAERQRLATIVEATSDFVATSTPEGQVLYYNRSARRMLGLADDEDLGSIRIPQTHPDWAARLVMEQAFPAAIQHGVWRGETSLLSREGREIPVSQVILAHRGPDGAVEYLSTIARDISEEKRLRAALARALSVEQALRVIERALLQEASLQDVLELLCDRVVALGFALCWVGLREPDHTVRPAAVRGVARDYVEAVRVRWDDSSLGQGPGGRAIRSGRPAVVDDVATDPSVAPWREEALRRGYRSIAAFPLTSDGERLGFIAVYSEQPSAFDAGALRSLETLAQQATLAILTARQREELQHIRRLEAFHVERMPLAHILWDRELRVMQWNPAAERIFGWTAEQARGRSALAFLVPPEAQAQVEAVWAELLAGKETSYSINPNLRRDGTRIVCEWFNTPLRDASGQVVAVASMAQDVSEADRLRAWAVEKERQFHDLAEAMAEAILMADTEGRVTYANPAAERLFLVPRGEMVGRPLEAVLPSAPQRIGPWEGEGLRSDGERLPLEGSISRIEARSGVLYTYVLRDLSERRRYEQQLVYLADHDALTGLYNHRRFQQELERELVHARRYQEAGSLLLLDLDGFKQINDTFGHRAGDDVLVRVAQSLKSSLRETDILARVGPDEFVVLLPRTGQAEASALARQILGSLQRHPTVVNGEPVPLSASLGLAVFPTEGDTADTLLARADLALSAAKGAGGRRVVLASELGAESPPAAHQVQWERRLRAALQREAFVLYAQPIVHLESGRVAGYELLLRLADEPGRIVLPGEFIPVAERTGLIQSIDRWVVRQALHLLAEQARRGRELALGVNLSGVTFGDDELVSWIRQELAATGAPASRLVLEITETTAVADISRARDFVLTLKALGCRFALDDFGVGFGSFYYLKHLPVDYLKIDGSFVRRLGEDPVDAHVVKAIVEVARGLGIQTIAEGAEQASAAEWLSLHGVDFAQGYHFGRPLPVSEIDFETAGPFEPPGGSGSR